MTNMRYVLDQVENLRGKLFSHFPKNLIIGRVYICESPFPKSSVDVSEITAVVISGKQSSYPGQSAVKRKLLTHHVFENLCSRSSSPDFWLSPSSQRVHRLLSKKRFWSKRDL